MVDCIVVGMVFGEDNHCHNLRPRRLKAEKAFCFSDCGTQSATMDCGT